MHVVVTYDQSLDEMLRAIRAVRAWRRWLYWGISGLLLLIGLSQVAAGDIGGAGPLVAGALFPLLLRVTTYRAAGTVLRRFPGPVEAVLDPEKLVLKRSGNTAETAWHSYLKITENADFFLFFLTKQGAQFLPKRALTAEQAAEVRAFLTGLPNFAAS